MTVERLQGTDGIRGLVSIAEPDLINDPISAFLDEGILTEEFFELYTYAYCMVLIENNFASEFDSVVIGWDPRHISGHFHKAAIRGIRKSGLTAIVVDILPTPAISLYQLQIGAVCGFALTASHNPEDQSGIKIFLGHSNLKLFPEDDKRLTDRCFKIDFKKLKNLPIIGGCCNEHLEARERFISFMCNRDNHWVKVNALKGITVIVDCANGAFSNLIRDMTRSYSSDFVFTNSDFTKGINFQSGVADLEGVEKISHEDINRGIFSSYKSLELILKIGREKRIKLKINSDLVLGIVFDGDGDRCFVLVYDPFQDCILVLGGDILSFLQAKYFYKKYYCDFEYIFVNTIESDIEASRATMELGYEQVQCAVGDKWVLWHAFYNQLLSKLNFYIERIEESEFTNLVNEAKSIFKNMIQCSKLDALNATKCILSLENWIIEHKGVEILESANNYFCEHNNNHFAMGCEESGHLINLGINTIGNNKAPVYIGNSLKSGLNSIAAINDLRFAKNSPKFFEFLKNPFPTGFKKSLQVYYVEKSYLKEGSFRRELLKKILLENCKWSKVEVIFEKFIEEPEMLLLRFLDRSSFVASLCIRNSGTEDKIVVYLRGIQKFAAKLINLADKIYPYLLANFKSKQSLMAKAEMLVLECLENAPRHESNLFFPEFEKISYKRLLHEMSLRQNLIEKKDGIWRITNLGSELLNFSERSE